MYKVRFRTHSVCSARTPCSYQGILALRYFPVCVDLKYVIFQCGLECIFYLSCRNFCRRLPASLPLLHYRFRLLLNLSVFLFCTILNFQLGISRRISSHFPYLPSRPQRQRQRRFFGVISSVRIETVAFRIFLSV